MAQPLKEIYYTPGFFDDLARGLRESHSAFDRDDFERRIYAPGWDDKTLMERMRHTTETLAATLPADFRAALDILKAASARLEGYEFERMVFSDFVGLYGLDDFDASLPALEFFTQQVSAEFAIRPFIMRDQPRTLAQMLEWAAHPHPEVRRLASEGCRPRLPWGKALPALKADPAPVLPILERLRHDSADTVRRSVANNLNDIAKDNPAVVLETLRRWQNDESDSVRWITRHALRTLIKRGDPDALALLGYDHGGQFVVHGLRLEPDSVVIGESLTFAFTLESTGDASQKLMIDYVIHFMKASGAQKPKVFKLAQREINPGEHVEISKAHSFQQRSTRTHYPGPHALEIQINGHVCARADFIVR